MKTLLPVRRKIAIALLVVAGAVAASTARAAPDARPGSGWLVLFDGRTTAGWAMTGPGAFRVRGGALVSSGGMGLLWYTRRRFRDFELQLDRRVAERCDNSGVFVRFPTRPRSPDDAVDGGYEVQIHDCDPNGPAFRTGAVYGFAPAARPASRPAGTWNRYTIRVVGQRYTVLLNGVPVTRFTGERALAGHVGLQNHDPGSRVSFRRVLIRPLG